MRLVLDPQRLKLGTLAQNLTHPKRTKVKEKESGAEDNGRRDRRGSRVGEGQRKSGWGRTKRGGEKQQLEQGVEIEKNSLLQHKGQGWVEENAALNYSPFELVSNSSSNNHESTILWAVHSKPTISTWLNYSTYHYYSLPLLTYGKVVPRWLYFLATPRIFSLWGNVWLPWLPWLPSSAFSINPNPKIPGLFLFTFRSRTYQCSLPTLTLLLFPPFLCFFDVLSQAGV